MVKRKDSAPSGRPQAELAAAGPIDTSGVVAAGQTDLDLLRQGRIDADEYVRRLAESATEHLVGQVSAERLADLRELLAAQALRDPSLAEIAERLRDAATETSV